MAKLDLKNARLYIKDGSTPTPNQVEINIGEGTLSWTEKVTREYTKNRGLLDTVRDGDQEPMDISLDILLEFYKSSSGASAGAVTPMDALKKTGGAAAWVSTSADPCEPYAVDLEVHYDPPCGGEELEIYVFPDFRHEQVVGDLKASTLQVTGKCNATQPTVTRIPQTTGTGSAD